mmetsp:Transcript_16244/g.24742  ORF Transcript_16244/g.24742 Transcript_16244/m.24742 type:complete len:89 (+) Transcript_16244:172-438(+)
MFLSEEGNCMFTIVEFFYTIIMRLRNAFLMQREMSPTDPWIYQDRVQCEKHHTSLLRSIDLPLPSFSQPSPFFLVSIVAIFPGWVELQ